MASGQDHDTRAGETVHQPVMLEEVLEALAVRKGGSYIDATIGGAGHAEAIMERAMPGGRLLGLDRDAEAIARARARLARFEGTARLVRGNYAHILPLARAAGWDAADGILLDLGLSSDQLACPERGFSFQQDGPLDMRMDTHQALTAADLVNQLQETELAELFRRLGEEPFAGRIARAVVRERQRDPIRTTSRLAGIVSRAAGGRRGARHPATRTFQALRMAVNHELEHLEQGLSSGLSLLAPGGRMVVMAFHSLEDRMVKTTFKEHVGREKSLMAGGSRWEGLPPRMRWVNRRAWKATPREVARNPRARSVRLRAVEAM